MDTVMVDCRKSQTTVGQVPAAKIGRMAQALPLLPVENGNGTKPPGSTKAQA